jgi:hypothetical protein
MNAGPPCADRHLDFCPSATQNLYTIRHSTKHTGLIIHYPTTTAAIPFRTINLDCIGLTRWMESTSAAVEMSQLLHRQIEIFTIT